MKRKFADMVNYEGTDCSRGTRYGDRWFKSGYCYKALFEPGKEIDLGEWPTVQSLISNGAADGPVTLVDEGRYHVDLEGTISLYELSYSAVVGGKLETVFEITAMRRKNIYFNLRYRDLSLGDARFYTKRKRETRIRKFNMCQEKPKRVRNFVPLTGDKPRKRSFEPCKIIYREIPAFAEEMEIASNDPLSSPFKASYSIQIPFLLKAADYERKVRVRNTFKPQDRFPYALRRLRKLTKYVENYVEKKELKSLLNLMQYISKAGPSAKRELWMALLSNAMKKKREAEAIKQAQELKAAIAMKALKARVATRPARQASVVWDRYNPIQI